MAAEGEGDAPEDAVVLGRVVARRQVARRLAFVDLDLDDDDVGGQRGRRAEVMLAARSAGEDGRGERTGAHFADEHALRAAREAARLGDVVRCSG